MTRSIRLPPWRVDVTVRPGVGLPARISQAALARAMATALSAAGAPEPASVGLILSDDEELAGLNEQHLGKAGPTDVLSFPLLPSGAYPPHDGQAAGGGPADGRSRGRATDLPGFVLPPATRAHLGDVVVSVERAVDQAAAGRGGQTGDVQWSLADELRLLVTHGVLHLCGWDHDDPVEEGAMRALERRLLDR